VEVVEGGELERRCRQEPEVLLAVVGDRQLVVVARAQEAVAAPAIQLRTAAVPGVVGIVEQATLPVGGERAGGEALAVLVHVREPCLAPVRMRHPAEVVVERAVLHHQQHERVDRQVARRGQLIAALALRGLRDERLSGQERGHARQAGGERRPREELAPPHVLVRVLELEALGALRIQQLAHSRPPLTRRRTPCGGEE
jgi:hypothetical protein